MSRRRRETRTLLVLALLLSACAPAPALALGNLDIRIAPIVVVDESGGGDPAPRLPERDLLGRLRSEYFGESLSFSPLSAADPGRESAALGRAEGAPQTFFDAAMLCQSPACPALIYGYLKRTSYSYYAELKLVERGGAAPRAVFVGSDDAGHYERLMDDLAGKITHYLRDDAGIGPRPPRKLPERNLLNFPVSLGYWAPMGGAWSAALAGLVASTVGVRFVPARPLFSLWGRRGYLALGLDLEYALGTNQAGVEEFYLHTARLRMPVEAWLELGGGHRFGLSLGPLFEVDTMLQSQKYASTFSETRIESGASVAVLYQYALSESVSLGFDNIFDFAFYSPLLATYSPRFSVDLRLGAGARGQGHE